MLFDIPNDAYYYNSFSKILHRKIIKKGINLGCQLE
jgi:hypothetical protein